MTATPRPRPAVLALAAGLLAVGVARTAPGDDRAALKPRALTPLPLGEIRPAGWLEAQLRLQADGFSGPLDEFWPDIKDSAWVGGKAEGWERAPYWLDGLVPLAYELGDDKLKAKAKRFIDYILDHQHPDGWLGPVGDNDPKHKPYDVWPLFPLFKALTQYQEASGDPRVVPALMRCCRKIEQVTAKEPLYSWAKYRAADFILTLHWLHERTGEPWLLDLARRMHDQGHDWRAQFEAGKYAEKTTKGFNLDNHGVNVGMALKAPGVWARQSGDKGDAEAIHKMLGFLDEHHGQATGIFTCDEHLAGRSPAQGTELCTVAEALFSLETLISYQGELALADRLEKLAFNAFPATFKKDMTAHQYDQQANQVVCKVAPERVYVNNNPDSNLYGLEPNFGCCTANLHQGWPKLVEHLWMRTADGGLAAVAYAPSIVATKVAGRPLTIETKTDYPFRTTIGLVVRADEAVEFPLRLRIPGWAGSAEVTVGDGPAEQHEGRAVTIRRAWSGRTAVTLRLPLRPRLYEGTNGAVAVERGPLVFALKVGADWKKVKDREGTFDDWEVYPTTPWNYALKLDRDRLAASLTFEDRPMGDRPFSREGAPIVARAKGRRVPSWTLEKNAAAPPPRSPVSSDEPLEDLALIPYGCTDLRVTEFPTLGD